LQKRGGRSADGNEIHAVMLSKLVSDAVLCGYDENPISNQIANPAGNEYYMPMQMQLGMAGLSLA
jgi:hypothetical protein